MIGVKLSREEMDVIASFGFREADGRHVLSVEAVAMYVSQLRPKMDFKTGLIGSVSPVSIGGLRRSMALNRGRSSSGDYSLSIEQVRRCLRECELCGLLERRVHPNPSGYARTPMLFFARLAGCDLFRPNEVQHKSHKGQLSEVPTCGQVAVTVGASDVGGKPEAEVQHVGQVCQLTEVQHISALSAPVTVNYKNIYKRELKNSPVDGFSEMNRIWRVDQSALDYLCCEYEFPEDFLLAVELSFRLYWCERGGGDSPVNQWNKKFVRHVEFCLRRGDSEFVLAAGSPGGMLSN